MVVWTFPHPSTAINTGPCLVNEGSRCLSVSIWFERADALEDKVELRFAGVEFYSCTFLTSLTAEMVQVAYDKIVSLETSDLLRSFAIRRPEHVGLRHLMTCFDDGPCYQFLCREVSWLVTERACRSGPPQ